MPTCDDLKLGGTLSATGIAGGLSINNTALTVDDWSGILGNPGVSLTPFEASGRPGGFLVGDGLPRARLLNLNMTITRYGPTNFNLVEPTPTEQLMANTDAFLALLQTPQYLELTMADASLRFLQVASLDPAIIQQQRRLRSMGVPLYSPMAYWKQGGNQSTDTLSGADALVVSGNVSVYDAVLVFAGDGTLTCAALGWALTITGSTGAVTVDLGNRTVVQGGLPAEELLTRTNANWGWFAPGSNTVNATVSVGVTWRDSWA